MNKYLLKIAKTIVVKPEVALGMYGAAIGAGAGYANAKNSKKKDSSRFAGTIDGAVGGFAAGYFGTKAVRYGYNKTKTLKDKALEKVKALKTKYRKHKANIKGVHTNPNPRKTQGPKPNLKSVK